MSLSSLIVQREVATMRQVEEALARQVLYGGDLVTNLLEVAPFDEDVLTRLLAESMRLPPAPSGELPVASEHVLKLLPPHTADKHVVVPIALEGDRLVVAVAEPIPRDVVQELTLAVGRPPDQRAAIALRVRQAIARGYGTPLDRRLQRLLARLSTDRTPTTFPPPPYPPPPYEPSRAGGKPSRSIPPVRNHTPVFGSPTSRPAPSPVQGPATRRRTSTNFLAAPPMFGSSTSTPPAPPDSDQANPVLAQRRTGLVHRDAASKLRLSRRRRGPLTFEGARREADEAPDRDALLDVFFDFSRQYFDFSALFLVHGDIAEGRDAFGIGATRDRVVGIGVPLDLPSIMSRSHETRAPIVTRVQPEGLDAVLLADLQRAGPIEMAVVPLVVRTRAVALLLGDCGEAGVDGASVDHVVAFAQIVGRAFERIIVRRKLEGFVAGGKRALSDRVQASKPPGARHAATTQAASQAPPAPRPRADDRPPAELLAARRPTGPPIPREEPPDSMDGLPAAPRQTLTLRGGHPVAVANRIASGRLFAPPDAGPEAPPQREQPSSPEIDIDDLEAEIPADLDSRALFDLLGWETGDDPPDVPPPSSTFAVSAHRPPGPHAAPPEELPSVIVDLDEELAALVDRLLEGETDDQAERELLHQGERAMRVLMARFPGPLTFDRARIASMASPPRPSECGPLLRLVARERKVALPFVLERLSDSDPEIRGWATHMVCELPYAEAIPKLLSRLSDTDASTRASATHALAAVARLCPDEAREAIDSLAAGPDPAARAGAIGVMALLRDPGRVPELVRALGDADPRVAKAAHMALVQLTRQDLGADTRPWLRWWEQSMSRHRVEWLIDALTHDVSEIRGAAGEELRTLSREYFGYASNLPARDRERAQQRYRDWWLTEGRARFLRH